VKKSRNYRLESLGKPHFYINLIENTTQVKTIDTSVLESKTNFTSEKSVQNDLKPSNSFIRIKK